jgi:TRAP-type C4-dicarboxylate transport system permease small subunit
MPSRVVSTINCTIEWLVVGLFSCLVILGGLQVFFRYVVGSSLVWSEELSKIIFFYLIYLGASIAVRSRAFASVDYLYQYFPKRMKRCVDIFVWILIVVFLLVIIVLGAQITLKTVSQITPALEIPQAVVYFAVPFGSLIMMLAALSFLTKIFTQDNGK